ncbi:MAG: VCBS repeat-containing protein [Myxococcales bacterium]|nr:VCBS repeat-containing protein [Myxococcales bacterium]
MGFGARSLLAGDLTGDGRTDLVSFNSGSDTASVLVNLGGGKFERRADVAFGGFTEVGALGDMDGDGKLDLIFVAGAITVRLGNGDGTFKGIVLTGDPMGGPVALAVGDVDGDGKLDVAAALYGDETAKPILVGAVALLRGAADGSLLPAKLYSADFNPAAIAIVDLDGEGKRDLLAACANPLKMIDTLAVLLNQGGGSFKPAALYPTGGQFPTSLAIGDFSGDGKIDVAVGNEYSELVSLFVNQGSGALGKALNFQGASIRIATSDFDRDKHLDVIGIAASSDRPAVGIVHGESGGSFRTPAILHPTRSGLSSLVVSDLDGDGVEEVAVTTYGIAEVPDGGAQVAGTVEVFLTAK